MNMIEIHDALGVTPIEAENCGQLAAGDNCGPFAGHYADFAFSATIISGNLTYIPIPAHHLNKMSFHG